LRSRIQTFKLTYQTTKPNGKEAPHAINVGAPMLAQITTDIARCATYADKLWDNVEAEVLRLARVSLFGRFKDDPRYATCVYVIAQTNKIKEEMSNRLAPEHREALIAS
jgi:hypothetical protein